MIVLRTLNWQAMFLVISSHDTYCVILYSLTSSISSLTELQTMNYTFRWLYYLLFWLTPYFDTWLSVQGVIYLVPMCSASNKWIIAGRSACQPNGKNHFICKLGEKLVEMITSALSYKTFPQLWAEVGREGEWP